MAGEHLISQLEQEGLRQGTALWADAGDGGSAPESPRAPAEAVSKRVQQLEAAMQAVVQLVKEAEDGRVAAQEEAQRWRQQFEQEQGRASLAWRAHEECRQKAVPVPASQKRGEEAEPHPRQGSSGEAMECSPAPVDGGEAELPSPVTPCSSRGHAEVCNERVLHEGPSEKRPQDGSCAADGPAASPGVGVASPGKAPFHLAWGPGGAAPRRHKHDIVSFERGSIGTMVRGSKQITLHWEAPPRRVLIINKPGSQSVRQLCADIIRWLQAEKGVAAVVEPTVLQELRGESSEFEAVETWDAADPLQRLHARVDLCVTLGGDGTVLWAANLFRGAVPPLIAFACGSLGFMTPFPSDTFREHLEHVLRGPVSLTLRNRLRARIIRSGEEEAGSADLRSAPALDDKLVLNEVAIDRGMSSALTHLECYCDGLFVTLVQGDGLILSTPSGSTAYSLAAGGSMVHPQVPAILFTPICPHSLSFRPLLLPEYATLRIRVPEGGSRAWASFDGKDRQALEAGDSLAVQMSSWPVPTVCEKESTADFLRGIHDGLHWNVRKPQGAAPK